RFPFAFHRMPFDDAGTDAVLDQMLQERCVRPPCPMRDNPAITPATAAIVRRYLEPDPERRYASASQLRDDLKTQLHNQPLRYTPEPSLRERLRKWTRRNPRLGLYLAGGVALLLLFLTIVFAWKTRRLQQDTAARRQYSDFHDEFTVTQFLLNTR